MRKNMASSCVGHHEDTRQIQNCKGKKLSEWHQNSTPTTNPSPSRKDLRENGRTTVENQLKGLMEAAEERLEVALSRVAAEDLVAQPLERPVVDDQEDTERAIIQLGGGDGAREVG